MDCVVHTSTIGRVVERSKLTAKGSATRERIVLRAAQLVQERGVDATSLDDIRAVTSTSKSQLFHYFPGGKGDLIAAVITHQAERTFTAQRPFLDQLDSWDAWEGWRRLVLDHYVSQTFWGCPISALARELIGRDDDAARLATAYLNQWRGLLFNGLLRMRDAGALKAFASPDALSLSTFASLQGGLFLTQTSKSIRPLEAALDGALTVLHAAAAP